MSKITTASDIIRSALKLANFAKTKNLFMLRVEYGNFEQIITTIMEDLKNVSVEDDTFILGEDEVEEIKS